MNLKKLWDDGGYGKDNPFENTVRFLHKKAEEMRIHSSGVDSVVTQVMLEVADGKEYPQDKCPCGCGIDKSGTAITHEMLKRLIAIGEEVRQAETEIIIGRLNAMVKKHTDKRLKVRFWNKPLSELFKKNENSN